MLMLLATTRGKQMAGALLNRHRPGDHAGGGWSGSGTMSARADLNPPAVHAARAVAEVQGIIYPKWRLQDWLRFAKRLYRLNSQGRMVLDYDQRIAGALPRAGRRSGVQFMACL